MLLRIAARQIEQIDIVQIGHLRLRIEKGDVSEAVHRLLIKERKRLGIAGDEDRTFPPWEQIIPTLGTKLSHVGNI